MKIPFAQPMSEPRARSRAWRLWRWVVPMLLVLLFLAVLIWLPWQARQMESTERQEQLIADTRAVYGWDHGPFVIPADVKAAWEATAARGKAKPAGRKA